MSTRHETSSLAAGSRRALALVAAVLLMASYLRVLQHVTDVAGGTNRLVWFVVGSLLAATVLARFLPSLLALALAAGLFVVGLWGYIQAVPNGELLLQSAGAVRADVLALFTGLSILRIMEAGIWAIGFAPAPTFLTWYFALRRHYVAAALVGSAALGFFVLTGDAGLAVVLVGVAGAAGVVGFGELERNGGGMKQAETLVVVLAAMVVLAPLVSVVPGGASEPLVPDGGDGERTIEGSLLAADDRVNVQGTISLSPEVRFTVESTSQEYWRAAAYDRYTGQGWVRTGGERDYEGLLSRPPGNTTTVQQTYEAEASVSVMPAAWKPTALSGEPAEGARVTDLDGLQPGSQLEPGDSYSVESQQPNWTLEELRYAGQDYPDDIESRYTQLPGSTPERVERRTDRLTANADNPYDTARIVERHLERSKNYSLNVSRPTGNIADSFLFEMSKGYCTYFATTMVTMLRTQDIPARFVTGYTDGQRVSREEWVVRGYDSHAWVEAYFPEVGWVRFDPTPGGPRAAIEGTTLDNARAGNEPDIDTNQSEGPEWTPTPEPTPEGQNQGANTSGANAPPPAANNQRLSRIAEDGANTSNVSTPPPALGGGSSGAGGDSAEGDSPELPSPSRQQVALGLVALVGLAAGARRSGVLRRLYRELWMRYQPSGTPKAETERAFARLEYLLARTNRPRRAGETSKRYLTVIGADERARRAGEIFERAHYGGAVSRAEADEAVALIDELVGEQTPLVGRLRRARSRNEGGPDSI